MTSDIFFAGKAGAGKSYCLKYLVEKYGYIQKKMATPVYSIAQEIFGMVEKDRKMLQIIGTDVGRQYIEEDIWINRMIEDVEIAHEAARLLGKELKLACDDVRFTNEAYCLKDMGWIGIYLDCPDDIRIKRLEKRDGTAQLETLGHVSEREVDEFKSDLIQINSSGSLEDMYKQIDVIIKDYKNV